MERLDRDERIALYMTRSALRQARKAEASLAEVGVWWDDLDNQFRDAFHTISGGLRDSTEKAERRLNEMYPQRRLRKCLGQVLTPGPGL